jgi:LysR family nitrogen assimilation transcriptional regulator
MAWLDLRRLTYFHAICDAGSISEAARRIGVPQPVLSYHLRELEQDFGGKLLSRSHKGVTPTVGGQLLLDHATIVIAQVGRAEAELGELQRRSKKDHRAIRLSAISSLATVLTPRLLQHTAGLPMFSGLTVIEANSREAREMLRDGELDFGIVIADDATPDAQWLAPENMLFCTAADQGDDTTGPIGLAEALAEPVMLPAKGTPVRELVERLAQSVGATVRIAHEIDGPNPRKQACMAGLGRTFLPWVAVRDEVSANLIRCRAVVDPPIARYVALEWQNGLAPDVTDAMQSALTQLLKTVLR